MRAESALPLSGINVLDLSQAMVGPAATQVLGDFGANIIKVERPKTGDLARESVFDDVDLDNAVFASMNRNKRSITLDLRTDEGRAIIRKMADSADVIVSNFRPHVMERLGLGYEDVKTTNPKVIWASASTYGSSGPHSMEPGLDSTAQAASGVVMRRADPTHPVALLGTAVADYSGAMHLAMGIMLALLARGSTGHGQRVEVSLFDSMLHMQMQEAASLMIRGATLNWAARPLNAIFETADRPMVLVGAFRPEPLKDLCESLGIEDLSQNEKFATPRAMDANITELRGLLQDVLLTAPRDHWLRKLQEADFMCAPVNDLAEALEDPQTAHNGIVWTLQREDEELRLIGSPAKLSETPARGRLAPPRLGADSDDILRESGYSDEDLTAFREAGALG